MFTGKTDDYTLGNGVVLPVKEGLVHQESKVNLWTANIQVSSPY